MNCLFVSKFSNLKSRIALPEVKGILTSRTRFLTAFNFNSFVSSLDQGSIDDQVRRSVRIDPRFLNVSSPSPIHRFGPWIPALDEIISTPYRYSISLVENEIHIIAQVVNLVRYLHSKSYLLNDFALENFLLRPDYSVKMTNAEKIRHSKNNRSNDSKNYSKESFQKIFVQNDR